MVKVDFQKAKKFFNDIKPQDKVTIFCHTDLDGFASGILLYDFCKKIGCNDIEVHPIDLGKDKLSNFNINSEVILITDLPPEIVIKDLYLIDTNKKVFYTDHHPELELKSPEFVVEYRTSSEIPSSRAVYELVNGKNWLAVAGVIADFGERYENNTEFINNFLKKNNLSLDKFKEKVVYFLSLAIIYFENYPNLNFFEKLSIIKDIDEIEFLDKYVKEVKEEVNKFISDYKKNKEILGKINFYYFNPNFHIKSYIINEISKAEPEKIFVFVSTDKENIRISARNQSKDYDVALMLKQCTSEFPNNFAGGHKAAAGAVILNKDLDKFKQNLKNFR